MSKEKKDILKEYDEPLKKVCDDEIIVSFLQRIDEYKFVTVSYGDVVKLSDVRSVFLLCLKELEKEIYSTYSLSMDTGVKYDIRHRFKVVLWSDIIKVMGEKK